MKAVEIFAVMKDGNLSMIVAKNLHHPGSVTDITEELAELLARTLDRRADGDRSAPTQSQAKP